MLTIISFDRGRTSEDARETQLGPRDLPLVRCPDSLLTLVMHMEGLLVDAEVCRHVDDQGSTDTWP